MDTIRYILAVPLVVIGFGLTILAWPFINLAAKLAPKGTPDWIRHLNQGGELADEDQEQEDALA